MAKIPLIPALLCGVVGIGFGLSSCGGQAQVIGGDGPADLVKPAAVTAGLEIDIHNAARLRQRLADGVPGLIWSLPAMQAKRSQLEGQWIAIAQAGGPDLMVLFQGFAWARLSISDLKMVPGPYEPAPLPILTGAAELGSAATPLWSLIEPELEAIEPPLGATAAGLMNRKMGVQEGAPTVAIYGNRLTATSPGQSVIEVAGPAHAADLRLSWDLNKMLAAAKEAKASAEIMQVMGTLAAQVGDGHLLFEVLPDGFRETMISTVDWRRIGYKAVERSVLNSVPADALMALAFGIDGATSAAFFKSNFASIEPEQRERIEVIGQMLKMPMEDIIREFDGTFAVAILPPPMGAPFPGAMLQIPWTEKVHQVIAPMMKMGGFDIPDVGVSRPLPLPPRLPFQVVLARSQSHLLVTTVPEVAKAWLAGSGGGFADSAACTAAAARVVGEAVLIGASNTKQVLLVARNASVALMGFLSPEDRTVLSAVLEALSQRASNGHLVIGASASGSRLEGKGLFGVGLTMPLIAAMIAGMSH